MTFQQLTFAVAVSRCASINKAAERLYTHQSNVSNTIRQLEGELGIEIFQRSKRGVEVTEDGREFLSYAEEILGKMTFVEGLYSARSQRKRRYFSVSSMRSYYLSRPILQMQDILNEPNSSPLYVRLMKHPFETVLDDVSYSRAEIGIVLILKSRQKYLRQVSSAKNLEYTHLGETQMSAVFQDRPGALEEHSLDKLTTHPYVVTETQENFGRFYDESSRSIAQLFQDEPNCIISSNDSAASQNIIAGSDAFFISSSPWQHSAHYQFNSIPLGGEDNLLSYYCLAQKGHLLSPLAQRFIQELRTMF